MRSEAQLLVQSAALAALGIMVRIGVRLNGADAGAALKIGAEQGVEQLRIAAGGAPMLWSSLQ